MLILTRRWLGALLCILVLSLLCSPAYAVILVPPQLPPDNSGAISAGDFAAHLPLSGAHHRPLLTIQQLDKSSCAWATGDFARYGRDHDANVQLAEIGVCHDFMPGLRFGVGIGKSFADQDLALGGSVDLDGEYVIAEIDYKFSGLPIIASVTGLYGHWDAKISRSIFFYGTSSLLSSGKTDVHGYSIRTRFDWLNAATVAGVSFSPRVSYTVHDIEVDAYSGNGGNTLNSVNFNRRSQTTHQIRFGVDAEFQLTEKILLRGMLEGVHRFYGNTPEISGLFVGILAPLPFTQPGINEEKTWGRAGGEIDFSLTDSVLLSASVNGSTEGADPDVSGGVSLKIDF